MPRVFRGKKRRIHFGIDDDHANQLDEIAQEEDRTISELMRQVVREWLEGRCKK